MECYFQYAPGDNRHMDTERGGRRGGRGGRGRGRGRGGGGRDGGRDDSDAPPRNDTPIEGGGFGGFGSSHADDPIVPLDNDAEFPSLM